MNREHKYGCRSCGDYIPPEGKMVDGKWRWAGFAEAPIGEGNGRCLVADRVLRRVKECPKAREEGQQ